MFDNGGVPKVHPQSRGVILAVNPTAKTDTLVGEYEHPTPLPAGSQGSLQALEDGNMFIGWGAEPYFSEYTANGHARVRCTPAHKRRVLSRLSLPMEWLPDRCAAIAAATESRRHKTSTRAGTARPDRQLAGARRIVPAS